MSAEFIVEKIGMSRTISVPSTPVTLLKVIDTKVCEIVSNGEKVNRALVAYPRGKKTNKAVQGNQKKYGLSPEYNKFATINVANSEAGDLDLTPLKEAKKIKTTFKSKGRGFSGVMKRWNFAGGPAAHGSRFHRRVGSIGMCEWPGRVMPGKKMPGHYGNKNVSVKNEVISFDENSGIIVLKGSVSGPNGSLGKIKVL